jgi:hypothetical protein
LSINIHALAEENVMTRRIVETIPYRTLFLLNSFFVRTNLKRNTAKTLVSMNKTREKINVTTFEIKEFISFGLMPRE